MAVPLVGRSDDVRRSAANPEDVREQLLAISQATVDRLLRPLRQPHGLSTTKPGRLLKKQIPIRTFTEWTDVKPGFLEGDLVAHCGGRTDGSFLYTFTLGGPTFLRDR